MTIRSADLASLFLHDLLRQVPFFHVEKDFHPFCLRERRNLLPEVFHGDSGHLAFALIHGGLVDAVIHRTLLYDPDCVEEIDPGAALPRYVDGLLEGLFGV